MAETFRSNADVKLIYDILENTGTHFTQLVKLQSDTQALYKVRIFQTQEEAELYRTAIERMRATPHRSVLRVYGGWQEVNKYTYCLQFGKSIYDTLEDAFYEKTFQSQQQMESTVFKIVRCLADLQRQGISHGQVTPLNIYVLDNEEIKMGESQYFMGFGIPYVGNQFGDFSAPEIKDCLEKNLEYNRFKADVYSLGLTLVSICALEEEPDKSKNEARLAIIEKNYGKDLANLVGKMLQEDPEERPDFFDVEQMILELVRKREENEVNKRIRHDGLKMRVYLDQHVMPLLIQGLAELSQEKPHDPINWLGQWLLSHDPQVL